MNNNSRRLTKLPAADSGFVLFGALMMLILLTMLGLTMANSFGLQEFIAGNQREKTKAFEAADAALNYAEWWLNQPGNAIMGANCSGVVNAPIVCSNALDAASVATVNWTAGGNAVGSTYTPTNMTISTTGGIGSYYAVPKYYIYYLGASPNTGNYMYQITALGYGGNANAVAVVQSIFQF
jgi:type IV pilus assembly protein PilX